MLRRVNWSGAVSLVLGCASAGLLAAAGACGSDDATGHAPLVDAGADSASPRDATAPPEAARGDTGGDATIADARADDVSLEDAYVQDGDVADASAPSDAADGGPAPTRTVVVPNVQSLSGLAVDATNVYFGRTTIGSPAGDTIEGVPKTGGTSFVIANVGTHAGGYDLHVAGGVAYWWIGGTAAYPTLYSAPVTARGAKPVAQGLLAYQAIGFAVSGDYVYSSSGTSAMAELPLGVDAGMSTIFFTTPMTQQIQWVAMAFDATSGTLDVLDRTTNQILCASVANGSLAASVDVPIGTKAIGVHGSKLYWVTTGATSSLWGANLDGSHAAIVAQNLPPTGGSYDALPIEFNDKYAYLPIEGSPLTDGGPVPSATLLRIDLSSGATYPEYASIQDFMGEFVADVDGVFLLDDAGDLVKLTD